MTPRDKVLEALAAESLRRSVEMADEIIERLKQAEEDNQQPQDNEEPTP